MRFIEGFSTTATPLTRLTQKEVKLELSEESFQELKRRLTIALVLTLPSRSDGCVIYNDGSNKDWDMS
jgi:hypothetical protein